MEERFATALASYRDNNYKDMIEVIAHRIFGDLGMARVQMRYLTASCKQGNWVRSEWMKWRGNGWLMHRMANGTEGLDLLPNLFSRAVDHVGKGNRLNHFGPHEAAAWIIGDGILQPLARRILNERAVAEALGRKLTVTATHQHILDMIRDPAYALPDADDNTEKALQTLSLRLWARRASPESIREKLFDTGDWHKLSRDERHRLACVWAARPEPAFGDIVSDALVAGTVELDKLRPTLSYVDDTRFSALLHRTAAYGTDPGVWARILVQRIRSGSSDPAAIDAIDVNPRLWLDKSKVGDAPLALLRYLYDTRPGLRSRVEPLILKQLSAVDRRLYLFARQADDVAGRREYYASFKDPGDLARAYLLERTRGDEALARELLARLEKEVRSRPPKPRKTRRVFDLGLTLSSVGPEDPVVYGDRDVYLRFGRSLVKATHFQMPSGYLRNTPQIARRGIIFGIQSGHAGDRRGVYCLDLATGKTRWYNPMGPVCYGTVLIRDGRVFVCTDPSRHYERHLGKPHGDAGLYCLDCEDGRILWYLPIPVGENGSPQWKDGHLFINGGYHVDPETGRLLAVGTEPVEPSRKTVDRGGMTFVLCHDGAGDRILCVEKTSGKILWEEPASVYNNAMGEFRPVQFIEDMLYIGGQFLDLDAAPTE
ncbi:MAG: hypothetical protein AMS16_05455 [Planctomycetes bacterium DG_58]|nr:MAG: hypothetical protein AMS16_05455 [Planctomycetes bacterium DG_58]